MKVPARYNIGVDACDRHADGSFKLVLIFVTETGVATEFSFDYFRRNPIVSRTSLAQGCGRGDRLAILLQQSPETAPAHLAAFKAVRISVPLFTLFGQDLLQFRLSDSGVRGIVTDATRAEKIRSIRHLLPGLEQVFVTCPAFDTLLKKASDRFVPVETAPDDPALLVYTSCTTGNPKGAIHVHRVLLGHLPGVELPQDFFPQPGDRF